MFAEESMSLNSSTVSVLPWLVSAWIATVVIVATLIYLLARAVLGKTDPQRLPEVLRALTPLLNGIARTLTHLPSSLSTDQELRLGAPTMQTGDTPPTSVEEVP
jgi:hypothetical protein